MDARIGNQSALRPPVPPSASVRRRGKLYLRQRIDFRTLPLPFPLPHSLSRSFDRNHPTLPVATATVADVDVPLAFARAQASAVAICSLSPSWVDALRVRGDTVSCVMRGCAKGTGSSGWNREEWAATTNTHYVFARAKREDVMSRPRQTATRSPLVRKRGSYGIPTRPRNNLTPFPTYLGGSGEANVTHPPLRSNSPILCNDGTRSLLGSITPPARPAKKRLIRTKVH